LLVTASTLPCGEGLGETLGEGLGEGLTDGLGEGLGLGQVPCCSQVGGVRGGMRVFVIPTPAMPSGRMVAGLSV